MRRAYVSPSVNTHWNLLREFEEMMKTFNNETERSLTRSFSPQAEIKENDKGYLLSFDIPGIKEEDLKIEYSDSILRIFGERKSDLSDESDGQFQTEKYYGRFERQFRLPESVNESGVEAQYKDGVLQVFLPKSPAKTAKKIEIKKGEPSLMKKLFNSKTEGQN